MIPRCLAITPGRPGPWVRQLPLLVDAGVDGLLLRLTDAPAALSTTLDAIPPGLTVLVRPVGPGDAAYAIARGLGLHLPAALAPADWRAKQPKLLSVACHNRAALRRAADAGADMALLSPVYAPGSKPGDPRPTLGPAGFTDLAATVSIPVLALGGITPERVASLPGAAGVAGISAFFRDGHVLPAAAAALSAAIRLC